MGLAELFGSFVRVTHNLETGCAQSAKPSAGSALAAERARKEADENRKAAEVATAHRRGGLKNAEDIEYAVKSMALPDDEDPEGGASSEEVVEIPEQVASSASSERA